MKLKVCGMKYPDNIQQVAALGPDYMGFIFYPGSKRHVDKKLVCLPDSIKKTGVFVNAALEEVLQTVHEQGLDAVQLHGEEDPDFCRSLKERELPQKNLEIIKVFPIGAALPIKEMHAFTDCCDFFLFDTKGSQRGGTGRRFDWSVLEDYDLDKPYFLSGGIGPGHIDDLKNFISSGGAGKCFGVDVNSRFEKAAALKDVTSLKAFISEFKKLGQ